MESVVLSYIMFILIFIFSWTTIDCNSCFSMTKIGEKKWLNESVLLSDLPQSTKKTDFKLARPADLKWNGSSLTWKPGRGFTRKMLTNFLLQITQDYTWANKSKRDTRRLLLGPFKIAEYKVEHVFSYDCIHLEPTTERATFTLWPLSKKLRGDDGSWIYNDYSTMTWDGQDQKKINERKELNDCIHKSKIRVVTLLRINETAFRWLVTVDNQYRTIKIEFYLNRNDVTIHTWLNYTSTAKNITEFHEDMTVDPGQNEYVLKVRKHCPGSNEEESYHKSNTCSFNTAKDVDVDVGVVSVPIAHTFGTLEVNLLIYGSGSVALLVIILVVWRCNKKKKAFGSFTFTTSLLKDSQRKRGPVAIIYADDSIEHRTRVYKLCATLKAEGINALAIDEHTRNKEMFENWIAEGEEITNSFQNFLFVVSPDLVNVCRIPGRQNTTGTEFNPQSASPVGHSKLPLVILNSIKSQALHFDKKNVQTVYFKDGLNHSSQKLIYLCKEFTITHRSVLHAETCPLTVKHDIVVKNKVFLNFIALYKHESSPRRIFDIVTCI